MLVLFPLIFVAETKLIYGYNFVAPLSLVMTLALIYFSFFFVLFFFFHSGCDYSYFIKSIIILFKVLLDK